MSASDLQPKPFKITVNGKDYICKPPRMSHRLIIIKVQPLFVQSENANAGNRITLTSEEILSMEHDIDVLISDLLPAIDPLQLSTDDTVDILEQILDHLLPADIKEFKEENVAISEESEDPKGKKI